MPRVGDVIAGKYQIERLLGSGGMGSVYAAVHCTTRRAFAVKVMSGSLSGDSEAKERFIREAKLAGSIEHPGVVEVYDVGHHGGALYMVMDLLRGESLGERLDRGALSWQDAVRCARSVLEAVGAAHRKGIVHRDLKPDNIFLCGSDAGDVAWTRILDFGISKVFSKEAGALPALTRTGVMLGTPLYMSPEQVEGAKNVDQRADIYAVGVILYQMLSGRVPFEANNLAVLIMRILRGEARPLGELVPGLPPGLSEVVARAMAISRADRYPSAEALSQALLPFDTQTTRSVPPPMSSRPPPKTADEPASNTATPFSTDTGNIAHELPMRRLPLTLVLGGGAALLVAAAMAVLSSGGSDVSEPPHMADDQRPLKMQPAAAQPAAAQPAMRKGPASSPAPGAAARPLDEASQPDAGTGAGESAERAAAPAEARIVEEKRAASRPPIPSTPSTRAGRGTGIDAVEPKPPAIVRDEPSPPDRESAAEPQGAAASDAAASEPRSRPQPAPGSGEFDIVQEEILDPFAK